MTITINATQSDAIKMGRNSTEWTTDIDITTLTPEQKDFLAKKVLEKKHSEILDDFGNITQTSIQSCVDKERAKEAEKHKQLLENVQTYRELPISEKITYCSGEYRPVNTFYKPRLYYVLDIRKTENGNVEYNVVVAECKRLQKEHDAKIAAWDAKYQPLIDAYKSGNAPRPYWDDKWGGSGDLLNALGRADVELATKRKQGQLDSAVARLGSETQKLRWEDGVMPVSEVIDLIRDEALAPLSQAGYDWLPSDEYHLEPESDEYGNTPDIHESDKKTLTDEQYVNAKDTRDLMPGWSYSYHKQYYKVNGDTVSAVYIRLSKKVGEIDISCDVEIG